MNPHDQFRFESNDELEYAVDTSIGGRETYYAPTGFYHDDTEQYLAVHKTTPLESKVGTSILRLMPWSDDPGRPEVAIVDSYLSNKLGADVFTVNMPGVDYPVWGDPEYAEAQNLTADQREDLAQGSFRKVGRALMNSVLYTEEVLRRDDDADTSPEFAILSSSMAVATAAGVVRSAVEGGYGYYIKGISLGEGVNYQSRNLARLALQFTVGQKGTAESLAQNPDRLQQADEGIGHWLKRVKAGRFANLAYFKALTKGQFVNDLGDLRDISKFGLDIPVIVHSGEISKLSPIGYNAEVEAYLASADIDVDRWIYRGVDHPYTMTVESMARPASQLV